MDKIRTKLKTGCWFFTLLWVSVILATGCKKDDETDYTAINEIVQQIMYYTYYWNDKIDGKLGTPPAFKPVPARTKPEQYFSSLLYDDKMVPSGSKEYDRWSFMIDYKEFTNVMVAGEYKSFGYFLALLPDRSIRVCYVYKGSPMANAGIERGYELQKINGSDVKNLDTKAINEQLSKESNRFVFADREGNAMPETTISKAVVKIDPILFKDTYEVDGKKVGYIVYNTFITASKEAITAALQEFGDVDEFVFDLRYNGGGDVSVADAICEHLLPARVGTDSIVFAKYIYSERTNFYSKELGIKDEVRKIKRNPNALNISRLFFIVSDMTASASEEVINSMKPFVDEVILFGKQTEGKPVGMLVFGDDAKNPQWAIAPITFRIDNSNDEGSYFAGMRPTIELSGDDLYRNFGVDPLTLEGEAWLQTVVRYIKQEIISAPVSVKSVEKDTPRAIQLKKLQIHAGCM